MTNTQRNNVRNWVSALRSGRYRQCKGYLIMTDGSVDPLGALAHFHSVPIVKYNGVHSSFDFSDILGKKFLVNRSLPASWFKKIVGSEISQGDIVMLNDREYSFDIIADHIEAFIKNSTEK